MTHHDAIVIRVFVRSVLILLMILAFAVFSRRANDGRFVPSRMLWLCALAFVVGFTGTSWLAE